MPLSVAFRWKTPNITAAQTDWEKNGTGEGIIRGAQAIAEGRQRKYNRERQDRLDRANEEDRQRRIADEERKKSAYLQAADLMRGKMQQRQQLVARAEQLRAKIAELRAQLGG